MSLIRRTGAILTLALKRLLSQRGLALASALGLLAAVGLTASIPLYTDAVYSRLLRTNLETGGQDATAANQPFGFLFLYSGAWSKSLQWEDVEAADAYLSDAAGPALGLPQKLFVRQVKTDTLQLFSREDAAYAGYKDPLLWVRLAFQSDLADHITLVEGRFPEAAASDPGSPVEVLASQALATKLGLQVGEDFAVFNSRTRSSSRQLPVRIAGIWVATDPQEPYWFLNPAGLDETLLLPEASFAGRVSAAFDDEVNNAVWYLLMDGSPVHADNVNALLGRIYSVRQQAASKLPRLVLQSSPVEALQKYNQAAGLLTVRLYAFSVPILGLVLAFISLVAELIVTEQRNEIAILRSRGATAWQVVGVTLLEGVLLGLAAVALGVPGGGLLALLIGKARSFLDFSGTAGLSIRLGAGAFLSGLAAAGVVLLVQAVPLLGAARHTIVTYKQERARLLRPPLWQRLGLDFLLLVPFGYGVYQLRQQGSLVLPGNGGSLSSDPFQNPLLFFIPALGVLALTLLLLRLLSAVMKLVAWLAARTPSVGFLLAARHLARTPGFYATPMILLVLTLSLSTFTASLAQTLENHLVDKSYYETGADANLEELGDQVSAGAGSPAAEGSGVADAASWYFLPVSEHLKLPGVQAATRVGRFPAYAHLSGGVVEGRFLGVDRAEFPGVAFWRSDFSPASLGGLMNALALEPGGVLVSRDFLSRAALRVGDPLQLSVDTLGQRTEMTFKVVGVFDLFPTWFPAGGPLFVGNLETLFEYAGGEFPYEVWMKTQPGIQRSVVETDLRQLSLRVLDWKDARTAIAVERERPERQGLFGVLSVGFAAAAVLTVLGFFLYALFSFRRRFIELGVLRAIGLSLPQMVTFLAWELAFLLLVGLAAGTGLGIWISRLFIPYLQIGGDAAGGIPPFQVAIAWVSIFRIYALFGLLFLGALGALLMSLLHMKIFQAVKLGETA